MKTTRTIRKNHALIALLVTVFCLTGMLAACAPKAAESLPAATSENASQAETGKSSPDAGGKQAAEVEKTEGTDMDMLRQRWEESIRYTHQLRREFPAPAVGNELRTDRGDWSCGAAAGAYEAEQANALAYFLEVANALFETDYTPEDTQILFCLDNTKNRSDIWRMETDDGILVGAVEAGTLRFLSADCMVQPADEIHESRFTAKNLFDAEPRIQQIAAALGATFSSVADIGGAWPSRAADQYGWNIYADYQAAVSDGRYCAMRIYGDKNRTLECIGVFPDQDCAEEQVYWRADLEWHDTVTLVHPRDFRKGTPDAKDMPEQDAIAFYDRFVQAANGLQKGEYQEPNLTFYVDHSGARDNYWHIEGEYLTCDLTRQGYMLDALCNNHLMGTGAALGLTEIPYEHMGEDAYTEATRGLFQALFGKDAVKLVKNNAVTDGHYCTMHVFMNDGTAYEMGFRDGIINSCTFFSRVENRWGTRPGWDADWLYRNTETGETFYQDW